MNRISTGRNDSKLKDMQINAIVNLMTISKGQSLKHTLVDIMAYNRSMDAMCDKLNIPKHQYRTRVFNYVVQEVLGMYYDPLTKEYKPIPSLSFNHKELT